MEPNDQAGSTTPTATAKTTAATGERADVLQALQLHRALFGRTLANLTEEQARMRPTVSELCLGGLVKHVAATEQEWARFIVDGPAPGAGVDWEAIDWSNPPASVAAHMDSFVVGEDETLSGLLERYDAIAAATDELVLTVDLDASQPLPAAPWFEPGATWSARRVFLHIVAETAQHAGHADIIRESIDGQRTMG